MRIEAATRHLTASIVCMIVVVGIVHTGTKAQVLTAADPGGISVTSVDTINDPPKIDTNRFFYSDGDDLEWTEVAGAESYHLQISDDPEFAASVVVVIDQENAPAASAALIRDVTGIRDTRYALDIDTGGAYYWRVRAVDRFFVPGPWSSTAEFSLAVASVAGTKDAVRMSGPNPCVSCLYTVYSVGDPITTAIVYDIAGRVVLTQEFGQGRSRVEIDLSSLDSGVYHVVTRNVDEVFGSSKVVVR